MINAFVFLFFMKKTILYLFCVLICLSCQKDNESSFNCDVDYVEIIDGTTARVVFEVSQGDAVRNYTVESDYTARANNYVIGDQLVLLENFIINGNQATFDFYYGENLGAFCAELFNAVPPHEHQAFTAQAQKSLSGKGIGKWKIKQKRTISN